MKCSWVPVNIPPQEGWLLLAGINRTCPRLTNIAAFYLWQEMRNKKQFFAAFLPWFLPTKDAIISKGTSSTPKNLQTRSPCWILNIPPLVFLCSCLPNFCTVLSLSTQMSFINVLLPNAYNSPG